MMTINFTVWGSGAALVDNYLIYRAAEASAPTTWVATDVANPPQNYPLQLFLSVDNDVPHVVEIWLSPDGVTLGTRLHDWLYNPSYDTVEIRLPIELMVDRGEPYDPSTGDNTFPDIDGSNPLYPDIASWSGAVQWYPEMRSKGGKLGKAEYTINAGNQSFTLAEDDQFYEGDYIFICFPPKITSKTPTVISPNLYNGRVLVTASATVDIEWYNKYVDARITTSGAVITLQPAANVAENKLLSIFNMTNSTKQLTIRAAGSELIPWFGMQLSEIYIGPGESAVLYKYTDDADVARYGIANELIGMMNVGKKVSMDCGLLEVPLQPNVSAADGTGLPVADYPRALWYANRLPPAQILSKADRDAGGEELAGYWAVDNVGTPTIVYKPDLRGAHERAIPGDRDNDSGRDATDRAGSYDGSHLMEHNHGNGRLPGSSNGGAHDTYATYGPGGRPDTWPKSGPAPLLDVAGDRDENTVKNYGTVLGYYI